MCAKIQMMLLFTDNDLAQDVWSVSFFVKTSNNDQACLYVILTDRK